MRRYFAIGTIVGAVAMTLGACGSDSGGNKANPDGGGATGGGGSGGTGGGGNQCSAYCAKLTAAGCPPANCASDCASKATCVAPWNNLVACAASTAGTVTCSGTTATVAGCDTQQTAYANCQNPSGGGTGGGGTGGGSSGSCVGLCGSTDPVPGSSPECYCDDACVQNNDCCADIATACPSTTTCKKYCCSAADCGASETCAALDATGLGTIGVCQAGTVSDAGTGGSAGASGAGGAAGAAGAPTDGGNPEASTGGSGGAATDGGGLGLPAGCVIGAAPPCNPVTNAGCNGSTQEACDLGQNGFQCFPAPNDVQPGGSCDNGSGPFCIAGYHCSE